MTDFARKTSGAQPTALPADTKREPASLSASSAGPAGSADLEHQPLVHELSGRGLVDYLATEAARQAESAVQVRWENATRRTTFILSIFAFLGFGGVFGIVKYAAESEARRSLEAAVPALTEQTLRPLIDREIGGIRQQLAHELTLSEFIAAVDALNAESEARDAFSDHVRDEVMERFREVAAVPALLTRPQVRKYLRDTIKHFSAANQVPQLNEIDQLAGVTVLADKASAVRMSMHYGKEVVGSAYALSELGVDLARLNKYTDAAEAMGFPEVALLWRIFVEAKGTQGRRTATLDRLVARVADLDAEDEEAFFTHLVHYSRPSHWQRSPTQAARELEALIHSLQQHYPALSLAGRATGDNDSAYTGDVP